MDTWTSTIRSMPTTMRLRAKLPPGTVQRSAYWCRSCTATTWFLRVRRVLPRSCSYSTSKNNGPEQRNVAHMIRREFGKICFGTLGSTVLSREGAAADSAPRAGGEFPDVHGLTGYVGKVVVWKGYQG